MSSNVGLYRSGMVSDCCIHFSDQSIEGNINICRQKVRFVYAHCIAALTDWMKARGGITHSINQSQV